MTDKNRKHIEKYGIIPYLETVDEVIYFALFSLERRIAYVRIKDGKEIKRVCSPINKFTREEYANAYENMGL